MRDNLISKESLPKNINKIKASSAEIVVHGTKEKPYYEIKYFKIRIIIIYYTLIYVI